MAWAAPTSAPPTRSRAPRKPSPSACELARPSGAAEALAEADEPEQHRQDDDRADGRRQAVEERGDGRQDGQPGERRERGAGEAEQLRQGAGSNPRASTATTIRTMARRSSGFTAGS